MNYWLPKADDHIHQKLYGMTDNLSKTLQMEKMSAFSRKNLSELTIKTIERVRNDKDFLLLFEAVKKGASKSK